MHKLNYINVTGVDQARVQVIFLSWILHENLLEGKLKSAKKWLRKLWQEDVLWLLNVFNYGTQIKQMWEYIDNVKMNKWQNGGK